MYPGTLDRFLSSLLRIALVPQNLSKFRCFYLDVARSVMSTRRLPRGVTHHATDQQWWDSFIVESLGTGTSQIVSRGIFFRASSLGVGFLDYDPCSFADPGDHSRAPVRFLAEGD